MISQIGFIRQVSLRSAAGPNQARAAAQRALMVHFSTSGPPTLTPSKEKRLNDLFERNARRVVRASNFSSETLKGATKVHYALPHRRRNKVVSAQDAVSLVSSGDTISCSGFVTQGAPEHVLKALGEHYLKTGEPHSLTLLFGGGPGDFGERGLNHLAKMSDDPDVPPMLKRTIGGHYGQVPKIAELALTNQVEAHILPMGSISRMTRAQAAHSPGHITTVGMGTFLDPVTGSGGAINEKAAQSELNKELITPITVQGHEYLLYKALPIDVAIIRATTGDSKGNLTVEDESVLADQMILAAAARNSSGIVIAQVKRLAADGSLNSRDVRIPGPMVDCVVVVPDELHAQDHPMSYMTVYDPVLTGRIRTPVDEIPKMSLTDRKVVARRAAMFLAPGQFVNLGIGLPDGVAAVAGEEDLLDYITLTTEPGVVGGIPSTGHEFGPASNPDSLIEMNQIFDYYNGSGLGICFLGAAQINAKGDVNVSRVSMSKLTGPGGFMDITDSTPIVCFMGTFTAKGFKCSFPGDGTLKIDSEGSIKKYVDEILETTFSGDQAMRKGQTVYYITERCVFRRTAKYDTIELIEIAPGVDLEKDILAHMDFQPVISPNLKEMDMRIFMDEKMNVRDDVFGSLEDRCHYIADEHSLYLDLFGISIGTMEDLRAFFNALEKIFAYYSDNGKNPINMFVNYDGFDTRGGLEEAWSEIASEMERKYYKSVKRYGGKAFRRAKLGKKIKVASWNPHEVFNKIDLDGNGVLTAQEIRDGLVDLLNLKLSQQEIKEFSEGDEAGVCTEDRFIQVLSKFLKKKGFNLPMETSKH